VDRRDNALPDAPPIDRRMHFAIDFEGVPGCAERGLFEDALRIRIVSTVAYWEPFAPISPWPLKIRITHKLAWFEGTAELYEPNGRLHREQKVRGPLRCYDVIADLARRISIDALLLSGLDAKRTEPVCSASKLEPVCPESPSAVWPTESLTPPLRAPEPDPPKLPEAPLTFRFGTGVWVDMFSTDRSSLGLTLDVGVGYRFFFVGIEARGNPAIGSTPFSTYFDHGATRFARVTGAALLCARYNVLVGCLKGEAGRLLFPGSAPATPAQLYAASGVRIGLEWPVVPWFLLRLNAELLVPINPASIVVNNQTVFQVAGWNAGLGLGALFAVGKR
jgi:hypothetical protein